MDLPFFYPQALLGLLSIIPLIILYMLLPKPFKLEVPSVMFLMKVEESRKKVYASITKIFKDPLFLVQLFILILLTLAAAGPYILSYSDMSESDTVIIIDASASMQAPGRMDKVLQDVPAYLSRTNTILLAESETVLVAEKVTAADAAELLPGIQAKAVTADISAAMSDAAGILAERGGNIVVFSDFTSWNGLDPVVAKKMFDNGLNIVFVPGYSSPAGNNVAIVNGYPEYVDGQYNYHFSVRNYGPAVTVPVKTITTSPDGSTEISGSMNITIGGYNTSQFKFENIPKGTTEVRLETDDAIAMDNSAWISIPASRSAAALFVTDSEKQPPSMIALSLVTDLTVNNASSVPDLSELSGYRFIVIDMTRNLTGRESGILEAYAASGGTVVFVAGDYLTAGNIDVNISKLLPVKTTQTTVNDRGAAIYRFNNTSVTKDLNLSSVYVRKYIETTRRSNDVSMPVQTNGSSALFAYAAYQNGTVVYVGFNDLDTEDEWNNFAGSPEFVVFWVRVGSWIADIGSINEYNIVGGLKSSLPSPQYVEAPYGNFTSDVIYYDTAGIWKTDGNVLAVNLYNDRESNTAVDGSSVIDRSLSDESFLKQQYEIRKEVYYYLIIVVFLLMAAELIILKKRDEL
ncbi:BatA and WFA domain-containing protein [Methanosarcinaceae archaeon]|nr:BatA and WFA domain-containing protein [Methanosarcinaceae archaeon]MBQ3620611.1 BatA and WFA domain-containing protein [Methanosarcinaceae archaeon]